MTYADLEAASQIGITQDEYSRFLSEEPNQEEDIEAYLWAKINELAEVTKKGEISAYWPLPVNLVSFCPIMGDEGRCAGSV
jgi:hypothetical protein